MTPDVWYTSSSRIKDIINIIRDLFKKSRSMQSDQKLKKREREKTEREKKERERDFKYLLTLILTGGS